MISMDLNRSPRGTELLHSSPPENRNVVFNEGFFGVRKTDCFGFWEKRRRFDPPTPSSVHTFRKSRCAPGGSCLRGQRGKIPNFVLLSLSSARLERSP